MQELNASDSQNVAQIPRTIEVELTRDLVEICSTGDVVTVLGLVKVMSTDSKRGVRSKKGSHEEIVFVLVGIDLTSSPVRKYQRLTMLQVRGKRRSVCIFSTLMQSR